MSLLLRDQVRIGFCADRLLVVRLGRGIRPRVVAKQVFPVDADGADWKPAFAMLATVLKQDAWQRADAAVVLSNRFVRYQLLPWSDAPLSRAEQRAHAQHVFAQAYGEAAASLELRLSDAPFGALTPVSGIEQELAAGIRDALAASPLKLLALQPYLMSAFNGWRRKLGHDTQWFVLIEAGMMCAGLLHQGQWQALRTRQVGENWFEELQLVMHREQLSNHVAEQVKLVSVYMPQAGHATLPVAPDWSFRRLQLRVVPGFAPVSDGQYGMALAGAL